MIQQSDDFSQLEELGMWLGFPNFVMSHLSIISLVWLLEKCPQMSPYNVLLYGDIWGHFSSNQTPVWIVIPSQD